MNGICAVGFIRTTLQQLKCLIKDQQHRSVHLGRTTGGAHMQHDTSASCISAKVSPPQS